uniref:Poly [ADP-ribose] polymerase 3 n=1 Tax=Tanacetum cinerariifolium TaxID=118510 RepID=A0A6L2JKK0_TANCI|nr:poly [ADP-ribose] polymerase 3 [Tanacetum cinerariifolium]
MAFSEDELSAIAAKLCIPLMLDSYTYAMSLESWCRSSFARAMIELRADVELKDTIVVSVPKLVGDGFYVCTIRIAETKVDNDYDPYDDDLYDGYDMPENLQTICDDLNIKRWGLGCGCEVRLGWFADGSGGPPKMMVAADLFCGLKGIKREFSIPRTLQQNGIAERKNRTLIEAAKTLLADLLLPIPFWAEAVNTACYVQNRVLVTKPHNKTPYELLHGRLPSIGFMRPFGRPVTILNTLDPLGKFQGKVVEGFLVGYSVCSSGPAWLFDIDSLTQTMNYHPVIIENQSNTHAGFQDTEKAREEGTQTYVLFPVLSDGSTNPKNNNKDALVDGKEHDDDIQKSMSPDIHSSSCGDQTRKQGDRTENKDKGKSPAVTITGFKDLNEEFEECINNSSNEVNAAANNVDTSGDDDAVVPRCQDMMFYGALKDCPVCGGTVEYDGQKYSCTGSYSEWSTCTYSTREPPRLEEPINFPEFVHESSISDLLLKHQDPKGRPKRDLKPTDKPFAGMVISLSGRLSRTHKQAVQEVFISAYMHSQVTYFRA